MTVLDTNVLSELIPPRPAPQMMNWFASQPASSLYTTTVTQAEIVYGLELLPKGKRRRALEAAVDAMFDEDFASRLLPFDADAARIFGRIAASRRLAGRPIWHSDRQIAAIARSHGAALATRNTADFEKCGVEVVNPWTTA
jgi:predicted nucleic acid-binding protein